jgi:hypothetical protein
MNASWHRLHALLRLSFTGQNPCGPLAGNRDRDRRPCEGFSSQSATRPVANARTASRNNRGAVPRLLLSSTGFSLWILGRCEIENPQTEVCATNCANPLRRSSAIPKAYAMISHSLGLRAQFLFVIREAGRDSTMMPAPRSIHSCRALIFLVVLIGLPIATRSSTLEDSARELAHKIAATLPAHETVSCEIRNISSLHMEQAARIEAAIKSELQQSGIPISGSGAATSVLVTLAENFRNFEWTAEIRVGDTSHVVLITVERSAEFRGIPAAMPANLHSEKFWEGPQRILDAAEASDGSGKSWLVLLLPTGLLIQDRQAGSSSSIEIASAQSATRDPWGNLSIAPAGNLAGNTIAFFLSPHVCTLNLQTRELSGCLAGEGAAAEPLGGRSALMFDVMPPGPLPAGKGMAIEIKPICGGASQFLASAARDYTQTDSLQLMQAGQGGAVAVSNELVFAGPITALHDVSDMPRAVVHNLTTGNYEAYRLSISCAP